jgi:hypothetical protein
MIFARVDFVNVLGRAMSFIFLSRSPALMAGFNHSVLGVKGKRISCPPQ